MLLIIAAIAIGITLRRFKNAPPILQRMRPHFWLGYGALIVAVLHMFATFPMMGHVSNRGLDYATIALVALAAQTVVGMTLRSGTMRRAMRVIHLTLIAILAFTVALHVVLNGSVL